MMKTNEINEWEPPIDFRKKELPNFPISVFPDYIEDYIKGVSRELQVPIDMPAMMTLSLLSTLLTKKYKFYFKKTDWLLDLNLYILISVSSGSNKSDTRNKIIQPLKNYNMEIIRDKLNQLPEIKNKIEVIQEQIKKLAFDYAKKESEDQFNRREELVKELHRLEKEKIIPRLYITGNVTQEKLFRLLSENNEKIAIFPDEFSEYLGIITGKYSKRLEIELLLYGYDGTEAYMDREKFETFRSLENPLINIGAFVQPIVLNEFKCIEGRGLVERFLFSVPNIQYQPGIGESIPVDINEEYKENIKILLEKNPKDEEDTIIEIDDSALSLFEEINERAKIEKFNEDNPVVMQGWYAKLLAKLMKIISVLHITEQISNYGKVNNKYLGKGDLDKAQKLFNYFEEHAKEAFGIVNEVFNRSDAEYLLNKIIEKQINGIVSHTEIQQNTKTKLCADERNRLLDFLEDHNYIWQYKIGRKRMIKVNPYCLQKNSLKR